MKALEFINKIKEVANNYNTLYVMGCFGAPLTGNNVNRYLTNHEYNKQAERTRMIKAVADKNPPYFGFDCVCLIKGILWGWNGSNKIYGGATYVSNGVPDIDADTMITKCSGVSTDFSNIEAGEVVWLKGHIGVYIGDGLVVECTPSWKNCVQITALKNIGEKSGYNARKWTKHGKLPYVEYEKATSTPVTTTPATPTTTELIYKENDLVQFTGCLHYTSSYRNGTAKGCKAGLAKVLKIAKGNPHPYLLRAVTGKGSTVYGWVNAVDVTSAQHKTHTVVRGDTLSGIANQYGTTVEALVKLNGIKDKNLIHIGQIIKLS